jgi:tRNA A-37 threonylcarbamoyl transferase component Bud32
MRRNGLHQFDVHLNNVLTDGEQLYLTDFGLASTNHAGELNWIVTQLGVLGCCGSG